MMYALLTAPSDAEMVFHGLFPDVMAATVAAVELQDDQSDWAFLLPENEVKKLVKAFYSAGGNAGNHAPMSFIETPLVS